MISAIEAASRLFEIQQHDLAIERLQLPDQGMQPIERPAPIQDFFLALGCGERFQAVIERDESRSVGLGRSTFEVAVL